MSILLHALAVFFGILMFLFFFWRRLKEDYSAAILFSSAFLILLSGVIGLFLFWGISRFLPESSVFTPSQFWFWGSFSGLLIGVYLAVRKYRIKQIEAFEAAILGFLLLTALLSIANLSLVMFLLSVFSIFCFTIFSKHYRSFSWYKSGKVGFTGLAATGIYFLSRAGLSLISPNTFGVAGRVDFIPSAVVAFLLLFSLYNLSES